MSIKYKDTPKATYICDKCNKKIDYNYRRRRNVYKYYSYNYKTYAPVKDFDLCANCEKKVKKMAKRKRNSYNTRNIK